MDRATLICQIKIIKTYFQKISFFSVVLISPAVDWQYSVPFSHYSYIPRGTMAPFLSDSSS